MNMADEGYAPPIDLDGPPVAIQAFLPALHGIARAAERECLRREGLPAVGLLRLVPWGLRLGLRAGHAVDVLARQAQIWTLFNKN